MSTPTIDPSTGVDGALGAITGGVNDNLGPIAVVAGGLMAVGVVWKLVRRYAH